MNKILPSAFRCHTSRLALLLGLFAFGLNVQTIAQERPVIAPTNRNDHPEEKATEPEVSKKTFTVADDLRLEQLLTEPLIAQPLQISFDTRGRMWLLEYRQYPRPAGLKVKSHDVFWRAVYDKVPLAPPNHVRGKDQISIHEDTNGDGVFDKHKIFVDGLNIATACAVGGGGVWVLNAPYLLFYPDKNQDDIPDGDPEVHLAGFGMQDTHSVVNSITFGPDGWLYAAQGSTVNGNVIRPGIDKKPFKSLGQNIWRYHPKKKIYEIFAEGGGNAFCVEFDRQGRIYSGHNGGNTRGFHYVQGGFYRKGFSKHGPLSNPFAYGFFNSMQHHSAERFTHSVMIYEADLLPKRYRNKMFGVEPLQGRIVYADFEQRGSTFKTKDAGFPVTSSDSWFRPVDIKLGPEGAIYIADWYDGRVAHLYTMEEQVDATRGRVYRLVPKNSKPLPLPNLQKMSQQELINSLSSTNRTVQQLAMRTLVDRDGAKVLKRVEQELKNPNHPAALQLLLVRYQIQEWTDKELSTFWHHSNPFVRGWSIRLACDDHELSEELSKQLAEMAKQESNLFVRSQIASSARRIKPAQNLAITTVLLQRKSDGEDPHLPLLYWWNIESVASHEPALLVKWFEAVPVEKTPLFSTVIAERLIRRLVASPDPVHWKIGTQLLKHPKSKQFAATFIKGFELGTENQSLAKLPDDLLAAVDSLGNLPLPLQLRLGKPDAVKKAVQVLTASSGSSKKLLPIIRVAAELSDPALAKAVLQAAQKTKDSEVRVAAWLAMQGRLGDQISLTAADLPTNWDKLSDREQSAVCLTYASRKEWAKELVKVCRAGTLDPEAVPQDAILKMTFLKDDDLHQQIKQLWGSLDGAATEEMIKTVERLTKVLNEKDGDPYPGKKLYNQRCAKCHELFNEGEYVGPGLTSYQRSDRRQLLLQIVNPGLEIREGFELNVVVTADGRVLTGFITFQDDNFLVIRGSEGEDVRIAKEDIDEIVPQRKSLMPEGILKDLSDEQIADLFAYLQSGQPLNR